MEQKLGYSLVDSNNTEIQYWNSEPAPNPIILPNGDHIHAPNLNTDYSGYKLVERWEVSNTSLDLIRTDKSTITFDGTKIVVTLEYRNPDKSELLLYSANTRYTKETSGIIISNNFIYTDRQSQSMINGIITLFQLQPNTTINFKTGNGFIQANSQTIIEIASSVAAHVQSCFNTELNVNEQINNDSITKFSQVDVAYN
jgi:hypothetical protein